MRWKAVTMLLIAAALTASGGISAHVPPADAILMTKHLVRIDGHRRLNLVCTGAGSPAIVFEGGLGANLLTWQKVAASVSRLTRTCFYDRAGYGYSDLPGQPLTAERVTDDLHRLLRNARVRPPVILVGHSVGGLYATLYADRHLPEVAGLVLIDPSFAEQDKYETTEELARDDALVHSNIDQLSRCAELARLRRLRSEEHKECFSFAPERTTAERAFLQYQYERPARYDAVASEMDSQHSFNGLGGINSRLEKDAHRSFGDIPVIVLTAAPTDDGKASVSERALAARDWQAWKDGHALLAARSSRGCSLVVRDTGHFIQVDQPRSVISAIKKVIKSARASS